jgi:hypothetical protein
MRGAIPPLQYVFLVWVVKYRDNSTFTWNVVRLVTLFQIYISAPWIFLAILFSLGQVSYLYKRVVTTITA